MKNSKLISGVEPIIALVGMDPGMIEILTTADFKGRKIMHFNSGDELISTWTRQGLDIVMVIAQGEVLSANGVTLVEELLNKGLRGFSFTMVCHTLNRDTRKLALDAGIADVFLIPFDIKLVETRINFLIANWKVLQRKLKDDITQPYRIPLIKRIFDIFFAGLALLCLSPLLLVIYLWIRIESKGPAFYYSPRVGTGYKIFKFYKFRSMYVNADKRLKDLQHLNQYNAQQEGKKETQEFALCDECREAGTSCQFPMYADKLRWCEKDYMGRKKTKAGAAFFKLKDDPRITRAGKFIRNTSIDELPQLWNVIIGDMSIVGNRPLPLYEAEKLTTDKYALRFMAPAGITGLWQVEKRGKGEMSEEERLMLDNMYARNHSFINDIKLILRTIPALFQKENV